MANLFKPEPPSFMVDTIPGATPPPLSLKNNCDIPNSCLLLFQKKLIPDHCPLLLFEIISKSLCSIIIENLEIWCMSFLCISVQYFFSLLKIYMLFCVSGKQQKEGPGVMFVWSTKFEFGESLSLRCTVLVMNLWSTWWLILPCHEGVGCVWFPG